MHSYDVLTTEFRCNIYPRILICTSLFYIGSKKLPCLLLRVLPFNFVFQITAVVISVERFSMHTVNCCSFLAERMKLLWSLFIKQFVYCCGAHGNENVPCTQTRDILKKANKLDGLLLYINKRRPSLNNWKWAEMFKKIC